MEATSFDNSSSRVNHPDAGLILIFRLNEPGSIQTLTEDEEASQLVMGMENALQVYPDDERMHSNDYTSVVTYYANRRISFRVVFLEETEGYVAGAELVRLEWDYGSEPKDYVLADPVND